MEPIVNLNLILSGVMPFLRSCVEGFLYIKGNDSQMFMDAPTYGKIRNAEKTVGKITPISPAARAFI